MNVIIKPAELNLLDMGLPQTGDNAKSNTVNNRELSLDSDREEDKDFITIKEEDENADDNPPGRAVRKFKVFKSEV